MKRVILVALGLVALLVLIWGASGCTSESTKRRQVFECSLTGQTAACLQARHGWAEQDALVAALEVRLR